MFFEIFFDVDVLDGMELVKCSWCECFVGSGFVCSLGFLFVCYLWLDDELFDELEIVLIIVDVGVEVSMSLVEVLCKCMYVCEFVDVNVLFGVLC